MKEKSQLSTSLEFRTNDPKSPGDYILHLTDGFSSEISFYKSALENLQKTVKVYEEENYQYKQQNENLLRKCHRLQENYKELVKRLIKDEKSKSRELQMTEQIKQLTKKIENYEKTIEILEDKLLILNVAIRKQEYAHKFPDADLQTVSSNTQYKYANQATNIKSAGKFLYSLNPKLNQSLRKQRCLKINSIYQTPIKSPPNSPIGSSIMKMKRIQTLQAERNEQTDYQLTCRSSQFS